MQRRNRPQFSRVALGVLLLAGWTLLPGGIESAQAEDFWTKTAKECRRAIRTYDVRAWEATLAQLDGQDHPAAIKLVLDFYRRFRERDKDWVRPEQGRLDDLDAAGARTWFARLLPDFENPRSVRFAVETIGRGDLAADDILVEALTGKSRLHVVDDLLRKRFRTALKKEQPELATRWLTLLQGRLHVGDRAWIEREALIGASTAFPQPVPLPPGALIQRLRVGLRTSYPDAQFRVDESLAFEGRPNDVLTEAIRQAGELNARLDKEAEIPESFSLAAYLALQELDKLWPDAIQAAYHARLRTLLARPELSGLDAVHAAAVAELHAQYSRHDLYFAKRDQAQRFDKSAGRERRENRAAVVDFSTPAIRRKARILKSMRAWLGKHAPTRPSLSLPHCDDLLELNLGRKGGFREIAFTARDAGRRDLAAEVRPFNRTVQGVRPGERHNAALVNDYRRSYALLPLRLDVHLSVAARRHSAYCRSRGKIAHVFRDAQEPHGRTPIDRMRRAGYPRGYAGGENVFMGSTDAGVAFHSWRGSPAHRRNMLHRGWREIGVGVAGKFWTQNFGNEPYDQDHAKDPDAPK